jgi:hypothetical protein
MFMRYFGGGVGHLSQRVFEDVNPSMDVDSGLEDSISHQSAQAFKLPRETSNQDQGEREEVVDSSSDSGSDSESDIDSDDTLGPEDGENSDVDDNGYASF